MWVFGGELGGVLFEDGGGHVGALVVGYERGGEGQIGFAHEQDRVGGMEGDGGLLVLLSCMCGGKSLGGGIAAVNLLLLSCWLATGTSARRSGLVGFLPGGGFLLLLDCFGGVQQQASLFRHGKAKKRRQ
jgi:hypothetical protein